MTTCSYTSEFYQLIRKGSASSAEIIVPLVLRCVPARSVVDVGCGEGSWLAVFQTLGVDDFLGLDGDYIDRSRLLIPQEKFRAVDLAEPFFLERTFDLAISMEVAEHLPPESAEGFIESLARLAPAVLFSAAIPHQGGNNHLNEQWPDRWAALFEVRGYVTVDCVRRRVWRNEAVEWWYAQNTFLFARREVVEGNGALKAEFERTDPNQFRLVHPERYLYGERQWREALAREAYLRAHPASGLRQASRIFWECVKNSVRARVRRAR